MRTSQHDNSRGTSGFLPESFPGSAHANRAVSEPATDDIATIFLSFSRRLSLLANEIRCEADGKGPDRNAPMRASQPLKPDFSGRCGGCFSRL
jgi:hypothetical protein